MRRLFACACSLAVLISAGTAVAQTGPNRITHYGQDVYLNGINVAWNSWENDFTDGSYDGPVFEQMFAAIGAAGGNSVRMWVHPHGTSTPANNGSRFTGFPSGFVKNFTDYLNRAQNHGVLVMPCLWSFDAIDTFVTVFTNDDVLTSYIDSFLVPLVTATKSHKALVGWDIINEPEWAVERGRVSWRQMQRFTGRIAAAIHGAHPAAKVTVGAGSVKYLIPDANDQRQNLFSDGALSAAAGSNLAKLDFYQVHYYGWMRGDGWSLSPWDSTWALDKPSIIGEFAARGESGYLTAVQMHTRSVERGWAGTMSWAYFNNRADKEGYWPDARPGVEAIARLIPDAVDFCFDCAAPDPAPSTGGSSGQTEPGGSGGSTSSPSGGAPSEPVPPGGAGAPMGSGDEAEYWADGASGCRMAGRSGSGPAFWAAVLALPVLIRRRRG